MADFLTKLVSAELQPQGSLQPHLASRFESATAWGSSFEEVEQEQVSSRPHAAPARPDEVVRQRSFPAMNSRPDGLSTAFPFPISPDSTPETFASLAHTAEDSVSAARRVGEINQPFGATSKSELPEQTTIISLPPPVVGADVQPAPESREFSPHRRVTTISPTPTLMAHPAPPGLTRSVLLGENHSGDEPKMLPDAHGAAPVLAEALGLGKGLARETPLTPPTLQPRLTPTLPMVVDLPSATQPTPPTVNVTIGRVEVRASAATPKLQSQAREKPRGVLSLEEYLKGQGRA